MPQTKTDDLFVDVINTAEQQIGYQVKVIEKLGTILNPRTIKNGYVQYIPKDDWTSGFFPGTMFYMYDLTKDRNGSMQVSDTPRTLIRSSISNGTMMLAS